jgi:sulfate/thiosulfate transport system ATP-binding protein
MAIEVQQVSKAFGSFSALRDVSFTVGSGELVALLGPSGGGKSTLLRIISGLDNADSGAVLFDGESVDHLHARDRKFGFVFQHYALFRHMTVAENIAFGLSVKKVDKAEQRRRVGELLDLVGMRGYEKRYPSQLSGGQRQRVALARALAPAPSLLLLDEPFGAVDARVRAELRTWLRRLHDEMDVTSLFVTHDQDEAFAVADRVVVINKGRVEQVGTPFDILETPATEFVARFLGEVNVVQAEVRGQHARSGALTAKAPGFADGAKVRLVIRTYDIKLWRDDKDGIGTVKRVTPLGDRVRVEAKIDGVDGALLAHFPRRSSLLRGIEAGCRVMLEVTLARAYALDTSGSQAS